MGPARLQNRVALITNAATGIGKSAAFSLASKGCHLALASHDPVGLQELENKLREFRSGVVTVPVDLSKSGSAEKLIEQTLHHFARIDFLVCITDQTISDPVPAFQPENICAVCNRKFLGTIAVIGRVLPHMIERHSGQIVVVSSIKGKKAMLPGAPDAIAAFTLAGYMESLRHDFNSSGIIFSAIFPAKISSHGGFDNTVPLLFPEIKSSRVARAILKAISRKKTEIMVPGIRTRIFLALNLFFPRWGDWMIKTFQSKEKFEQTSGKIEAPLESKP